MLVLQRAQERRQAVVAHADRHPHHQPARDRHVPAVEDPAGQEAGGHRHLQPTPRGRHRVTLRKRRSSAPVGRCRRRSTSAAVRRRAMAVLYCSGDWVRDRRRRAAATWRRGSASTGRACASRAAASWSVGVDGQRLAAGDDVPRLDAGGRTLMPGLIDAHVHAAITKMDIGSMNHRRSPAIGIEAKAILEGMLRRGFTTIRDAAGWTAVGGGDAVARGRRPKPRLVAADGVPSARRAIGSSCATGRRRRHRPTTRGLVRRCGIDTERLSHIARRTGRSPRAAWRSSRAAPTRPRSPARSRAVVAERPDRH